MSYYTLKKLRETQARFDKQGGEATQVWQVRFINDQYDSVMAVLVLNANGLTQGAPYSHGKVYHALLRLEEMNPRPASLKFTYNVECVFRSPPPPELQNQQQPPPGQFPPGAPADARPFVRVMSRGRSEAIHKALFLGAFNAEGEDANVNNPRMPRNTRLPVANSAEVPLLPPRERLVYDWALIVTSYTNKTWSQVPDLLGYVNEKKVRLRTRVGLPGGGTRTQFDHTFAPRTLLLYDESWDPHIIETVPWNVVTREVLVRLGGWHIDELDRGLSARAQRGDPDGSGGSYSNTDLLGPNGVAVRRLLDPQGNPITDPILLDGKGQPLNQQELEKAIFLRWLDQHEADFVTLADPWS